LYWRTAAANSFDETHQVGFPVTNDGRFHDIDIPLAAAKNWNGERVAALRLDPANEPAMGTEFELAGITALTAKGEAAIPVGQTVAVLSGAGASNVEVSPDGQRLAWWASTGKVHLWRVEDNKEEASVLGSRFGVSQLLFRTSDPTLIVVGARAERGSDGIKAQGVLFEWDLNSYRLRRSLEMTGLPASAVMLPDGQTLAVGLSDGQLTLRRLDRPDSPLQDVSYLSDGYAAAWSPDGKTAASGGADGVLRLWDTATWKTVSGVRFPETVVKLRFSPDSGLLAVGEASGRVTLWQVAGSHRTAPKRRFELLGHSSITGMAFSKDGARLATCASANVHYVGDPGDNLHRPISDASLRLWDTFTGKPLYEGFSAAASVAFTPDGKYLAAGQESGQVNFANPETGALLFTVPGNISAVTAVAVSPDGHTYATGAFDGDVRLFDYDRKAAVTQLQGFGGARGRCPDIAFSPDGKRLAAASYQGLVKIYDATTRQFLRDLGHGSPVHAVAFSPDSKRLLTNGRDQSLRVWNVETGAEIRKLSLVTKAVALAPNGAQIARADADGVVRLWAPGEGAVTTLTGLTAPSPRQSRRLAELEKRLEGSGSDARTPTAGKVQTAAADRTRPMAHYPLNEGEGTVVRDAAKKQNGTARGPIAWGSDASGRFLALDGTGCVDLGDAFNFDRTSRFSYGGWVRPTDGRPAAVLSRMEGSDRFTGWDLFLIEGRAIVHLIADFKVGDALRISSRDVVAPSGEWHHLFVTYDGSGKASGLRLYVDGVLAPTTTSNDTLQGSPRNAGPALIGARSPHSGDTNAHQAFKGDLSSLRVYNRTLAPEEVSLLAQASGTRGKPRLDGLLAHYALDKLTGGKTPAAFGGWGEATAAGKPALAPGRFGQAIQFDGASRRTLPKATDIDTKTPFSAGAWVKTADASRGTVLSTQAGEGSPGWELWLASGGVRFELVQKWPEDWAFSSTADGILPVGEWRHVFVTCDGSGRTAGVKIFVDGKPVANTRDTGEVKGSIRSSQPVSVGSRNGGLTFKGAIDEVTIFSRTLSAAEVALLANTSSKDLIAAQTRNRGGGYLAALKERDELAADIAAQSTELTLVRYSPDGRRLLIAGKRGDAQIVAASDGKPLIGLPTAATMAAFSPDGGTVVTSDEKKAQIWEAATGALLGRIPTGKAAVQAVAFQADGRAVAAALVERGNTTIVFWDLAAKRVSRRLGLPGTEVTSLEFDPAGKYLAAGVLAGQIRLWSLPGMNERSPLRGHRGAVLTLAFAPDGVTLASGSRDATVRFWNLLAGREVAALRGKHEQAVAYARFASDGLSLLTSSADAPVRVWRAPDPKALDFRAQRFASAVQAPEMPAPLRVTGVSRAGEIALTWQPVRGATGYEVRRATAAGGPYLPIARTIKPVYQDRGLAPGVKYLYSIAGSGAHPGAASTPISVLCSGPPLPPTGLTAQAYGKTVTLTWDEAPGAGGYVVSRAEKPDGPFVVLAKDLASGYFEDESVPAGEFYYRVAASVGTEVGAPSAALSVRPPWSMADIGGGKAGSAGFMGEQIKVTSFGSRIGGTDDQFRFVYQPAAGDVEIVAAVDRTSEGAATAKRGLMIRASDLPGSTYVYFGLDGAAQSMTARAAYGQPSTAFAKIAFPGEAKWLKLVRRGDRCTALASADGKAWLAIGWTPAALSSEALVGLAVSGATNAEATGTFNKVHIRPPSGGAAFVPAARFPAPPGSNLCPGGPSNVYTNADSKSTRTVEDGIIRFTSERATKEVYDTGLLRNVPLVDGTAYTLQFRARADRSRTPRIGVQTAGGDYAESGLSSDLPVDTEWRTFRFTFTARVKEPIRGTQLYFHLGDAPGSFWLADVVLVPQSTGSPGGATSTGSEPRLTALPPAMEPVLKSGTPSSPAVIRFVNSANRPVQLFWLNYQGARESYGVLPPGASREQVTATHSPWLVTREGGSAIAIFVPQTAFGVAEITQPMLSAGLYPMRSASAGKAQLDLTQTYNAQLDESWHGGNGPSLAALAPGITVVNGIAFDVRGIISTTGAELEKGRPGAFPVTVQAVPVGMPVQALHFLHSTGWMAPVGTEIGRYVLHYADGSTATMPIVYGQDVRDWATGDDATPAPALRAGSARLYVSTWRNPKPGIAVVSFDFVSTMTTCAPFLVAVTADLPETPDRKPGGPG
jgi:WD40 repeat protein